MQGVYLEDPQEAVSRLTSCSPGLCAQVERLDDSAAAGGGGRGTRSCTLGAWAWTHRQPSDLFYRLALDRCFYVGGMGAACQAEDISAAEYKARAACVAHHVRKKGARRAACAVHRVRKERGTQLR